MNDRLRQLQEAGLRALVRTYNRPHSGDRVDPDVPDGALWKHECDKCILEGRPADFLTWIEQRYPEWPSTALAQLQVGAVHMYLGNYDLAKAHTQRAFDLGQGNFPLQSQALCNLARLAFGEDKISEAFRLLGEADQGTHLVHMNRLCFASILKDASRLGDAIDRLELDFPNWSQNARFTAALDEDGELDYLRERCPALWKRISNGR